MRLSAQIAGLMCLIAGVTPALADDWLPVTPEDLHFSSTPEAPGAPAVILYRQVDRNDAAGYQDEYTRVKILTEDGRKYGDVELRYYKDRFAVRDIIARTIRPDGSVVPFVGTVFDKEVLTAPGGTLLAKTFQMPDVEPGCIVEYRARYSWEHFTRFWVFAYNSQWILSDALFTRAAKFSLIPERALSLRWSWPNGLPAGTDPPHYDNKRVVMQVHDVPAFVSEEYMPPENGLKQRVDFIYSNDAHFETDPGKYWKVFSTNAYKRTLNFTDQRAAMDRALAQVVLPGDQPDDKLRKIYARAQRVRNLSYEPSKTAQETKREEPAARNVAEVWERNAGSQNDINWLFLGLAQAAGLQAEPVLVARRNETNFDPRLMISSRLDTTAVVVSLGGKEHYFSPGVPFTPYGMLPWNDSDARGLRLNADASTWITTPQPDASQARVERKAALTLSSGSLDGKLTVIYTGVEAAGRRIGQRNEDEVGRRQFLERQLKSAIPAAVEINLTNNPDWSGSDTPLVAEFNLHIAGWATSAGRRQLLPLGLFSNGERHMFEHETRVQPIYFEYPHEYHDEVVITLPPGWRAESVPEARSSDLKVLVYRIAVQSEVPSLRIRRDLSINFYEARATSYPSIQGFFQTVKTGDELQAVIGPDPNAAH